MTLRPPSTRAAAAASLFLVIVALVRPAVAAAPPRTTEVGPDGHWLRLFPQWPIEVAGGVVHDALHNRVLLAGANEIWELPLDEPLAWNRLSTTTGSIGGAYLFVVDPGEDRLLAVTPSYWTDSMHVRQLPLSDPTTWSELGSVGAPDGTWSPSGAVFDPAAHAIQIIAGSSPNPFGGPTTIVDWSCTATTDGDDVAFSPVSSAYGLGARTGIVTALDAARARWLVYGGIDRTSQFHDVRTALLGSLTFDAPAVSGAPPSPSQGYAVVDPARDRMLFHGAVGGATQLWQLSLAPPMTWSPVATAGGPPTRAMALVYDAGHDRVVAIGKTGVDELWTLSPGATETWTDRSLPHPVASSGRVVVGDPGSSRLVYHASGNDLWALSTVEPFGWTRLSPAGTAPPSRTDHEGVYDSARDRMILFGGHANFSSPPMNDVWAVSLGGSPAWSVIAPTGTPPAGRYWPSAIYDPAGDRMLVWGGANGGTQYTDLWQLTMSGTPQWSSLSPGGTAPGYIQNANAIHDPVRGRMLIAGGIFSGQCWALTVAGSPAWSALPTCPGSGMGAVYDAALDRLVALTGSGDLYALSLASPDAWQPLAPTGSKPSYAIAPALVADAAGNRAFVLPRDGSSIAYELAFGDALDAPRGSPVPRATMAPVAPNPASTAAVVRVSLPAESNVTLDIFDPSGRRVRRLIEGRLTAGDHPVSWDLRDASGRHVGPGVFVYALTIGGERVTRRALVLR